MNQKPSYVGQGQWNYGAQNKARVNWDGAHYLALDVRRQEDKKRICSACGHETPYYSIWCENCGQS